jgi:outer membrane protein TolC
LSCVPGRRFFQLGILVLSALAAFASATNNAPRRDLDLKEFLQLVLERNESLQVRLLEVKIAQRRLQGEKGIFEPELLLGYDHVRNQRENTAEQRRSSGVAVFEEENNIYTSGIEQLVPIGGKIRLGYTMRDLRNNLQDPPLGTIFTNFPGREYQSFFGVSLTQPLLKNAWFSSTLANIRLAALLGDVAFQEYRRQLMILVTTAEASYWNLFLEQEQVRFLTESVRLAEDLVKDTEERARIGSGSELEVMEARAAAALRRTKLAEAEQKYFETSAQLSGLMSEVVTDTMPLVRATDLPDAQPPPKFAESAEAAIGMNPDYLAQLSKLRQENVRLAYAKNQRLPQLDLKGSYGLNGLGPDVGSSWDDIEQNDFPSWSVGVELRIPLGGGIRSKNEVAAAKMRKEQGLLQLKEIENQILNSVTTTLRKLRTSQDSVGDYERIVTFNQSLLETERKRLEAGTIGSRRVLEIDAALFESRNAVVEAKVLRERARLELELVQGTVLRDRALDLSRKQLEEKTVRRLQDSGVRIDKGEDLLNEPILAEPPSSSSSTAPQNQQPPALE